MYVVERNGMFFVRQGQWNRHIENAHKFSTYEAAKIVADMYGGRVMLYVEG